ncbi:MFS transporter [Kyrpidia spormannii]|uniref:MFS transporter n=1 Tax=Kyrpidia spormannii TaxID=2055160 RepID=A0A2K8N385_9BACL|nr:MULTISPECIES: MFS transporter [Kyrpidia]ATY83971.1 MFS transporter [Kyrpidia spormannii]MCL6576634.1 MFS transporter [Kyrpidia sp.]
MDGQIAARLDRLPVTSLHRKLMWLVGIGVFFDLYDVFLAGIMVNVFKSTFGIGAGQQSAFIAAGFIGMFVGAATLGGLSDRYGRRTMYLVNLGIYSLFTLLAGFGQSFEWILVCRIIAGLGLGAELPLSDAYLSEMLPARVRGRYIAIAYTLGFCAVPVVGFIARWLVPTQILGLAGWRWVFILGAVGAILVWIGRRGLPESPRWLEVHGRREEAERYAAQMEETAIQEGRGTLPPPQPLAVEPSERIPIADLFRGEYRKRTIMLWLFQILQTVGYYGFGSLGPLVLAHKGFDIVNTLMYSGIMFLGYPIGSLLSLPIIERWERKAWICSTAFGMAVFGLLFAYSTSAAGVLIFGFLYTAVSNIFSNAFHVYQAEIYPTRVRGTAVGSAYSLSRLTSAVMPFVLVPLLQSRGAAAMYGVVALAMLVLIADIAWLGPRTTKKALEQVSA